jgi:NAD(P)H-flavin reductase
VRSGGGGANPSIERPYTPVESGRHATARVCAITKDRAATNYAVELAIKVYEGGAMSSYLSSLKAGHALDVRPDFDPYLFRKLEKLQAAHMRPEHVRRVVLFAGGSGITPMLQLAHQVRSISWEFTSCSQWMALPRI